MKRYRLIFFVLVCLLHCKEKSVKEEKLREHDAWVNAESGLRVRSEASIKSKRLGTIPLCEKVKVLDKKTTVETISGREGRWTQVEWGDIKGWAFDGFLQSGVCRIPGIPIIGDNVKLYSEPNLKSTVLAQLSNPRESSNIKKNACTREGEKKSY